MIDQEESSEEEVLSGVLPGQRPVVAQARALVATVRPVYWALFALLILLAIVSPRSIEPNNLLNILRQSAPLGIVAIGQTFVLATGNWDLSVGSIVAIVDVVAAQMIAGHDDRVVLVTFVVLALGAAIGLLNGLLVTRLHVDAFIATLGTSLIVTGAALVITGGHPRGDIPDSMTVWGNGFVAGVPISAVVWLMIALLAFALLNRTVLGRRIIGVGANSAAAHLVGVNTNRVKVGAFMICGVMSAAAGWLFLAFVGSPTLEIGTDFLLGSFAAAVIGGTALIGGRASIWGTVAGTLFLMVLFNLLTVLNLPTSGRRVLEGSTILIAVALAARRSR